VAKKPTQNQINDFTDTLKNLGMANRLSDMDIQRGRRMYMTGLKSTREILNDLGIRRGMSDAEYEMGTDLTKSKSIREAARDKGKKLPRKLKVDKKGGGKVHGEKKKKDMMGGGKMYASMNKRYANGGKIYPRKGNV
tara:strand:- start:741 stop:1151 length:411 start_codon:yes stop_codon:yes gene_type:complete